MALPTPDETVVARIKLLAAADSTPALEDGEITTTIQAYPMVDRYGVTADVTGWEPTWNIYAIVSELWSIKAGKVAGNFNFGADEATYNKGDVMAHCLAMQAKYAAMVAGSAPTGPGVRRLPNVVVNG